MPMKISQYLTGLILLAGVASPLRAADGPNPAETKLREALRATMLQLRTAENERATLQAAQAETERKSAELAVQVEALTKQVSADKEAADKSVAGLTAKLQEREVEVARLNESLAKWKVAHKEVSDVAGTKESQRARLAGEVIVLNRKVADQQTKNAAMFKLGNEILVRYERFGLGDALTAREPFIGITRVKFQNLIQDFGDKLAEQKIKP